MPGKYSSIFQYTDDRKVLWVKVNDSLLVDQRESDVGVNFQKNFQDQLLLVNFMVLNTTLGGDRAGEDAFSLEPPKNRRIYISRTTGLMNFV